MEYGLRPNPYLPTGVSKIVLILILLEYGLRPGAVSVKGIPQNRLNPYSIGIWSATHQRVFQRTLCSPVLILILLEYGLRRNSSQSDSNACRVLILILLEYGLRQADLEEKRNIVSRLNPYSIGIWSATQSV